MKIFGLQIGVRKVVDTVDVTAPKRISRRNFVAGRTDRLTSKWTTADQTVNMALLTNLRAMRARSRDFARNNEYGRKFFGMVRANVIGHAGFTLKVDCKNPDGSSDVLDSQRVAAAYKKFSALGEFEVTGKLSETMFDMLAMSMIARDGEVLVRRVRGKGFGVHGFQLQLLPAHLLNEEHNVDLSNGGRIRMGVEFDSWMKPVAYHLRLMPLNGDMHGSGSQRYERVPASEMLHLFIPEEVDQWRGVPWVFAGLRNAHELQDFDLSAMTAARVGAAKMGFFRQIDPEAGAPMGVDEEGDDAGYGGSGEFIDDVDPGTFNVIPDGYQLESFDPKYPNEIYDSFKKSRLRTLATGLLVSYHSLAGDLTDVNFSSIRSGTLEEREMWKVIQNWYAEAKKKRVFKWWLEMALMNDSDLKRLPYTKFDKFNAPEFFGRRWDWVDPRSDMLADKEAVALGVKSRSQIIRERGRDPDQVWAELDEEAERGFTSPNAAPAAPGAQDDPEEKPEK